MAAAVRTTMQPMSRCQSGRSNACFTVRPSRRCRAVDVRSGAPAVAAAAGVGAPLVDPSAGGSRRIVVPQKLDPARLDDVRNAEAFGPRGMLLVGMSQADCAALSSWFSQMEPGFVITSCPAALLASPAAALRQAVEGADSSGASSATLPQHTWEAAPAGTPPVVFFSGMTGEEQVAVMEGWAENTGLEAPAFASVTSAIMDKPLARLLSDIVRAQAQQPPPGYDAEVVAEVQAAAAAAAAAASGTGSSPSGTSSGGAAGAGAGAAADAGKATVVVATAGAGEADAAGGEGEQALRSKLQDYVMLNTEGQTTAAAPMSLDALKDQIQDKMRAKKAAQAAADKQARREGSLDETDLLRQTLRGGRSGGKAGGKKQQGKSGGGGGGKGFGG